MADGIIGSVGVGVVPDASSFWRDFEAKTSGGAVRAGEHAGREWRVGFDRAAGRTTATVKVNADTAKARAEIAALSRDSSKSMGESAGQANLLRDAIIALGPAAIPAGAVMAGAFAGAIPAALTLALGIKGIADEMKSGALVGTNYGRDIALLQGEFGRLKSIAAGGLLSGLDRAMQQSGPLFRTLNGDIRGFSAQIGGIVAHIAPALVSILHDLNPLFVTFGNELTKGAATLEHFATSGTGLQSFVAYVQAELPTVEHTLGELIRLVVRLGEGLAPLGHVALSTLGVLASALNAIPVDVLSKLETTAVAAYAAFRTYGLISGIVRSVSGAVEGMAAKQAAAAAVTQAALLGQQAAEAESVAAFATAEAAKANAAAEAAVEIAAAMEGTGSVLAATATAAAEDAIVFAAAMQAEADAAALSATEIAAAAAAAAEGVASAGVVASIGWAGLLPVIGAVAIGVGILGAAMLSSGDDARTAAADQNSYADSVKKTTDALGAANIAQTNKNLSDKGALAALDKLHASGDALGVTYADLAFAVNGPTDSLNKLKASLEAVAAAHTHLNTVTVRGQVVSSTPATDAEGKSALALLGTIKNLRGALLARIKTQEDLNALERATSAAEDGGTAAARRHANALGLGTKAYLDAQTAARKAAASAQANTAAMQAESDAAGLLSQAFDRLNGKTLDISDARIQFAQSLYTTTQGLRKHSQAWQLDTQAGQANQQNVNAAIRSAQSLAQAVSKGTKLTKAGVAAYRESLIVLRQHLIAEGASRGAIERVNTALQGLAHIKIPPTKVDLNTKPAEQRIRTLREFIRSIRQHEVPGINVNTARGRRLLRQIQTQLDGLRQHRHPATDVNIAPALRHMLTAQGAVDRFRQANIPTVDINITPALDKLNQLAAQMYALNNGALTGNGATTATSVAYTGAAATAAAQAGPRPGGQLGLTGAQWRTVDSAGQAESAAARARAASASASASASTAAGSTNADGIGTAIIGGKKVWTFNGHNYSSLAAALNAKASAAKSAQSAATAKAKREAAAAAARAQAQNAAAQSSAQSLLGGVGQAPSSQINVGQTGIRLVERQINAARSKLASITHLTPAQRARYEAGLAALARQAQHQFDKIEVRIRKRDLTAIQHALGGTAAQARQAFAPLFADLRSIGASHAALARLHASEKVILTDIRERNRAEAHLTDIENRMKAIRASVKSAVTGSFDVTQAGTNPITGRVTEGSMLAQETQALNRAKKFVKVARTLENRHLVKAYLNSLVEQGPSALPEMEAIAAMPQKMFARFNRQEREIAHLGDVAGGGLSRHDLGAQRQHAAEDYHRLRAEVKELGKDFGSQLEAAIGAISIKLDGHELNRAHHDQERRNRRHAGRN
jgi:hypothetical protein